MVRETLHIEPGSNAFFDAGARAEEEAIRWRLSSFPKSTGDPGHDGAPRDGTRAARDLCPPPFYGPRAQGRRPSAALRPDHDGAEDGRLDARRIGSRAAPSGARDRHRKRLRDGTPGAARPRGGLGGAVRNACRGAPSGISLRRGIAKASGSRRATASRRGPGSGSTGSSSTGPLRRSRPLWHRSWRRRGGSSAP